MRTSTIIWIIVAIVVIGGLAYWFTANQNAPAAQTATQTQQTGASSNTAQTAPAQQAAVLAVASNATLGNYLTAANGRTLYRYTKDSPGVSNCTGSCATNWPPYTVASVAGLNAGNLTGTLGTVARADGSLQLTYNGMPLYFWHGDSKPGDTTGQNVGGVWFVVKP